MITKNATTRFSKTVENYVKFRPGYPFEFIGFLESELGLDSNSVIADIGSGTGKLTKLFLKNGNLVHAVEPNPDMRTAAENMFENYSNFQSLDGTAEKTGIENQSVDFITAAQAFHWFDVLKTKKEFQRILKPGGVVLLIWNKRLDEKSNFMKSYNEFLETYSTDLKSINPRRVANEKGMNGFFGEGNFKTKTFEHYQEFDFDGVLGRYLSCSYAYQNDRTDYEEMRSFLKSIFNKYEKNGKVKMWYEMVVYYGNV